MSWIPEASYGGGQVWRLESGVRRSLRSWLQAHAHAGRRWSEHGIHRTYFDVGLTARTGGMELSLAYEGNNLGFVRCGSTDACEPTLVARLAWHFWQ